MICCLIGASCPLTYWRRPLLLHGHDKRGSARRADTHKTSKREKKELGEGEKTWKTSSVFICWFVCFSFLFFLFVAMDAPASRTLSSLSLVYKQPAQKGEEEEEVKLLLSLERRTREFLFGSLYSSIGLLVSRRRRARYSIRIDYTNLLDFFLFSLPSSSSFHSILNPIVCCRSNCVVTLTSLSLSAAAAAVVRSLFQTNKSPPSTRRGLFP